MFRQRIAVFDIYEFVVDSICDTLEGAEYETIGCLDPWVMYHFDYSTVTGVITEEWLPGIEEEDLAQRIEVRRPGTPILFTSWAWNYRERPILAGRCLLKHFTKTQLLWAALSVFGPWGERVPPKRSTQPLFVG